MKASFQANAVLSKLSKNYMELKKNLPIRPSEMGVLNIITQTKPPHTAMLLGEMLGVSKPMITAYLSVLERKGYIIKQQSRDDKRVFFILPTQQAHTLVMETQRQTEALFSEMIRQMGQSSFDELIRLAGQANQIVEEWNNGHER